MLRCHKPTHPGGRKNPEECLNLVLLISDEVPEQRLVFKYDAAVDGQNPVPLGMHNKQCDFVG